ncbi:MAG: hypothetical protein KC550_07505, partial [Nanoarchaeota archaeon]|nr:hypothetical protein [Nanoarchaeota archaeon]
RNALHNGPATEWLKKESENPYFLKCTRFEKRNPLRLKMLDREAINHFCAFTLIGIEKYTGNMDQFLADTLIFMNEMKEIEFLRLSERFNNSMMNNFAVFGDKAFQLYIHEDKRYKFNIAYFDVLSVMLAAYSYDLIKIKKDKIYNKFVELQKDKKFQKSTTFFLVKADRKENVLLRFQLVEQILSEVMK